MTIHCPSDTFYLITDEQDRVNRSQISNFALFYRYFLDEVGDKFGLQTPTKNQLPNFSDPKNVFTHQDSVLAHLRNRQIDQLRHLASSGEWLVPGHFYCATSWLDWRMVIGLGGNHVQETNMTLDHIYGIPYLPGSAFKGVVRSWVIQEYFCNDEKLATRDIEYSDSNDLKRKKEEFFAVFGSQKNSGKVHFLDGLPAENVRFELDVMNPHFSDYYRGATFPTDDQDPNPIYFLTLKGLRFRFLIYAEAASPLQLAKDWFIQTIENRGFGAKSAGGYGYFRKLDDKTEDVKYKFAEKFSIDDAYTLYNQFPDLHDSIHIDVESLVSYTPKFAVIMTEDICKIAMIGGVSEIPETLIEIDVDMVIPSEFGKWVWEKTKDRLFERDLSQFPNLVDRAAFRRKFKGLSIDQRKLLREKLLQISTDFRRKINRGLPDEEREALQYTLLQISEELKDENSDQPFTNLPQDTRSALSNKIAEIAYDMEDDITLVIDSLNPDGTGQIHCEDGFAIVCTGMDEAGRLILDDYIPAL